MDDWILVTEDEIAEAVYLMVDSHHKVRVTAPLLSADWLK